MIFSSFFFLTIFQFISCTRDDIIFFRVEYEGQIIAFDSEIERLQDLIFQIQSKLKQYQNKYGPLVPENSKERESLTSTNNNNNNTSKSDIMTVTEETKRDIHSQRMDEG